MIKQKRKKLTVKELTTVANNIIQEIEKIQQRVSSVEVVLTEYIAWKKDEKKYQKYFKKLIEDRTSDSLLSNEQQEVSSGK